MVSVTGDCQCTYHYSLMGKKCRKSTFLFCRSVWLCAFFFWCEVFCVFNETHEGMLAKSEKLNLQSVRHFSVANILCHPVKWTKENSERIDICNFLEYVRVAVYNLERDNRRLGSNSHPKLDPYSLRYPCTFLRHFRDVLPPKLHICIFYFSCIEVHLHYG